MELTRKPAMILFDFGQTIIDEYPFDPLRGTQAVLDQCTDNPLQVTAREVQDLADQLNRDIGRFSVQPEQQPLLEIHNHAFMNYLYAYCGVKVKASLYELERIFWQHAAPGCLTDGLKELLIDLRSRKIRTAVISNISYSGRALQDKIRQLLPVHDFEFILATSEYVFRKPHRRIFELALRKSGLAAEQACYCGDNPYCDAEGSHAAGLMSVWYTGAMQNKTREPSTPHMKIGHWQQLQDKLDQLEL